MSKQTFMQGTLILVVSGLINKVLGFIYRISLTRLIGDEGIGLFQMAFPILTLVITLATLGLNVAISKHVSEAEALHDESRIRSILLVSMGIVLITSFVLVTFMVVSAPLIARYALTDQRAIYALMGIAPTIPIVAAAHIFRGYFQGRQNMFPSSAASVIEQVVRIFTVLFFASLLMPYGVEFAAAGGMIGMVVGEFAGLCLMLYHFKKDPSRPLFRHPPAFVRNLPLAQTVRGLFRISMPVTASRLVGHVTYAFEPILVAQSLALSRDRHWCGHVTVRPISWNGHPPGVLSQLSHSRPFCLPRPCHIGSGCGEQRQGRVLEAQAVFSPFAYRRSTCSRW